MRSALIGYTGFVGSNLLRQHAFDDVYNSKNIESIAGHAYDVVVCAGMPAEKWKANQNPVADRAALERLLAPLRSVKAVRFVVISTVDVYPSPTNVDESCAPGGADEMPYGQHRRLLEEFAAQHFSTLVLRLPGLFGRGLKKNVIYDFLNSNRLDAVHADGQFQFYGLHRLWADVQTAEQAKLSVLNLVTEPVTVREITREAFGMEFSNQKAVLPTRYDVHSRHAALFGGDHGYLQTKSQVLAEIKAFVDEERL